MNLDPMDVAEAVAEFDSCMDAGTSAAPETGTKVAPPSVVTSKREGRRCFWCCDI